MATPVLIRRIEEAFLGAWPALAHVFDDGWVLRFADGYTKRSNSVALIYPALATASEAEIEAKIDRVERWYRARGLPPVFRVTPLADPSDLKQRLEARGYVPQLPPVRALYLPALKVDAEAPPLPGGVTLRLDASPHNGWLEASLAIAPLDVGRAATLRRMVDVIVPAVRFGWVSEEDGRPLAAAFVVVQDGLMTTFHVVTAPAARRRGLMKALLHSLTAWAIEEGATAAALFVGSDNEAAGTLYERLRYEEIYQYHYSVGPAQQ